MDTQERRHRLASSLLNFLPSVVVAEHVRTPITITDVTLRDGQQAAEVAFTPEEEIEIAQGLEKIGVPAVQTGYAGINDDSARRIRRACPDLKIVVLLVGWRPDARDALRSARQAGGDVCSIMFRSAFPHIANLGLSPEEVLCQVRESIRGAASMHWSHVMFTPSHTTSADLDFLMAMYRCAIEAGATIVSVSDSMGKAKPSMIRFLVEQIRAEFGSIGIRVHMHNDYGLALANTLAGVEAGANWVDATINGLGERAGNCALEEVALALEALYHVDVGIRTEDLYALCKLVETFSGVRIPSMKPVVGEDCFANKLEIHVQAAASNPRLMEPYDPSVVGNRRRTKLGLGTGPTGIRLKLEELGLELPEEAIAQAVRLVAERAVATKRAVTDDDFRKLVALLLPASES